MEEHGFSTIAPYDIMDADGSIAIPVAGGVHLKEDMVCSKICPLVLHQLWERV